MLSHVKLGQGVTRRPAKAATSPPALALRLPVGKTAKDQLNASGQGTPKKATV
jgi:hypothetical protein